MKKSTFIMLLIGCSILFAAVGFANANVNEQPCSDGVGLVDDVVINIQNQIVIETAFDLQRIDNYTLVSVSPASDNMVKDLQTSNVATSLKLRPELVIGVLRIQLKARTKRMLLSAYTPQERGASMQLVFYTSVLSNRLYYNK